MNFKHAVFDIEEELKFRPFKKMLAIVDRMAECYLKRRERGYRKRDALFWAFHDAQRPGDRSLTLGLGAKRFYKRLRECIREVRNGIVQLLDTYLEPYKGVLAMPNRIKNTLDPCRLFEIAIEPVPKNAPRLKKRRAQDAKRNFTIALQLLRIHTVDSEYAVAEDLEKIDELSEERLFKGDEEVWIAVECDPENENRPKGAPQIFRGRSALRRAHAWCAGLTAEGRSAHVEGSAWLCRWSRVDGCRYLVYVLDRGKEAFTALLKLERNRGMTDRRGWKYVVVGVEEDGVFRVASFEDAMRFNEISHERLWHTELSGMVEIPTLFESEKNPYRSEKYRDCKTRGYFFRKCDGRVVRGGAEQLVMSLSDFLAAELTTGEESHETYRRQQIESVLLPRWWWYIDLARVPKRKPRD